LLGKKMTTAPAGLSKVTHGPLSRVFPSSVITIWSPAAPEKVNVSTSPAGLISHSTMLAEFDCHGDGVQATVGTTSADLVGRGSDHAEDDSQKRRKHSCGCHL
jgi:hypothetical protein